MGHFRDPKIAWVQTPQWFHDLPEGESLTRRLTARMGRFGGGMGRAVETVFGPVVLGQDPFVNDPRLSYDAILRRRNWANAAFCCGAGSMHRFEAVIEAALRAFSDAVSRRVTAQEEEYRLTSREKIVSPELMSALRAEAVVAEKLTPYRFHVSEDIYTSIILHSDRERGWKSVLHPTIESRMLSPQDLLAWTIQRYKYAGGSLDILFHENPIFRRGLTLPQKLMCGATFWSYLGAIWNLMFLAGPILYLASGIAPVQSYSADFVLHVAPFLVSLEVATMIGTRGLGGFANKASYIAFFPLALKEIWNVARGSKISFPVTPKDRASGRHLRLVRPHLAVIVLTAGASLWAVFALNAGVVGYSTAGVATNIGWGAFNCLAMLTMIRAAVWAPKP